MGLRLLLTFLWNAYYLVSGGDIYTYTIGVIPIYTQVESEYSSNLGHTI